MTTPTTKTTMNKLSHTVETALNQLSDRARKGYTGAVLKGRQNWSGSDLQGRAKYHGAAYRRQRKVALSALIKAGGVLIAVENNKLLSAVQIGMDDYGNALYKTSRGVARPREPRITLAGRMPRLHVHF